MRPAINLALLALCTVLPLTSQAMQWQTARNGAIPAGAVIAGHEHPPGNETLYICRAHYRNGLHPGKIRPAFGGCNIGWGGQERMVRRYEVLVSSGTRSTQGEPHPGPGPAPGSIPHKTCNIDGTIYSNDGSVFGCEGGGNWCAGSPRMQAGICDP
jgi:hypothetical protein